MIKMMAVTELELAGSFKRIGEDASDKDFIGKCEHTREREGERGVWRQIEQNVIAGRYVPAAV